MLWFLDQLPPCIAAWWEGEGIKWFNWSAAQAMQASWEWREGLFIQQQRATEGVDAGAKRLDGGASLLVRLGLLFNTHQSPRETKTRGMTAMIEWWAEPQVSLFPWQNLRLYIWDLVMPWCDSSVISRNKCALSKFRWWCIYIYACYSRCYHMHLGNNYDYKSGKINQPYM